MTFGLSAGAIGLIGAGAAVAGGAIAANGATSAANTQAGSADRATAAQTAMFDKQVELQQPWLQAGQQGLNRLQYLLGLSPGTSATPAASPSAPAASAGYSAPPAASAPAAATGRWAGLPTITLGGGAPSGGGAPAGQQFVTVYQEDPAGNRYPVQVPVGSPAAANSMPQARSTAPSMANGTTDPSTDPAFGSLMRPFSMSDFQSDPGYQFRQSEGEKGLQRAASVQGSIGSGKFLKDAENFNQGLAAQDYGGAFDRFNVGQTNQFNRLAAVSGIGQTAANQTGAAASNFGAQIGSNIIGAGNARAAGQVGGANAINSGIGQGFSLYQQNQLMNRLFPPGASSGYGAWNGSPMASTIYSNGSLGD